MPDWFQKNFLYDQWQYDIHAAAMIDSQFTNWLEETIILLIHEYMYTYYVHYQIIF